MSRLHMLLTKKMAEVAWRTCIDANATWQKAFDQYTTAKFHADTACQKADHADNVISHATAAMNKAQNEFYVAMEDRIETELKVRYNVVSPDPAVVSPDVVAAFAPLLAALKAQKIQTEALAYATLVSAQSKFYAAMEIQKKAYWEWDFFSRALAPRLTATNLAEKNNKKANTALWVAEAAHRKAKAAYLALPANSAARRLLRKVHLKYIAVPTTVPTTVPTGEE